MKKELIRNKPAMRTKMQLKEEVKRWAEIIKVYPRQIRLQKMTRKWASCSGKKWVSFNTNLLYQPRKFQNYVIVHELLHIQIPNHGKLFKSMMNVYLPGWEEVVDG